MIVELSDAALVADLLAELRKRPDAVVARLDPTTLEVALLGSYAVDAMQVALELRLRSWEMARCDAGRPITVEFTGAAVPRLRVCH